jgi:hypothetical protein
MWRHSYRPQWREACGCLLVRYDAIRRTPFACPRSDRAIKAAALDFIFERMASAAWLHAWNGPVGISCVRPWTRTVIRRSKTGTRATTSIGPPTDPSSGAPLSPEKNHLNQFEKSTAFEVRPLDQDLVESALSMQHEGAARDCAASRT